MKKLLNEWKTFEKKLTQDDDILYEYMEKQQVDSFLLEGRTLLNEGIADTIKKYAHQNWNKLTTQAQKKLKQALKKVEEYFLRAVLKAKKLLSKSLSAAGSFIKKVLSIVEKFKNKHPLLYKTVVIVLLSLIVFGIISLVDADSAQALIKHGDTDVISQSTYEQVKGIMSSRAVKVSSENVDKAINYADAVDLLDKLHKAEDVKDIAKVKQDGADIIKKSIEIVKSNQQNSDVVSTEYLESLEEVGEGIKLKAEEAANDFTQSSNFSASGDEEAKQGLKNLGAI